MLQTNRQDEGIALDILEHSPSIAVRMCMEEGPKAWSVLFITQNVQKTYGYAPAEFYEGGMSFRDLVAPEDLAQVEGMVDSCAKEQVDRYRTIYRTVKKSGDKVWALDYTTVVRDEAGRVLYCDRIITDYTDEMESRDRVEANLRQQEVLNGILQSLHSSDPDKALEIILDASGRYLQITRVVMMEDNEDHTRCTAVCEWNAEGTPSLMDTWPEGFTLDYHRDMPEISRCLDEQECCIIHGGEAPATERAAFEREGIASSAVYAVMLPDKRYGIIRFDDAGLRRWEGDCIAFMDNVSKLVSTAVIRKANTEAIEFLAYKDNLTGLTNRYRFEDYLKDAVDQALATGRQGYVMLIDMDDFKVVNEGYGHDYGDALLVEVANYFTQQFADKMQIFRFGGDEFMLLLSPAEGAGVQEAVDEILSRARSPWEVLDKKFYCTISIGVVAFPSAGANVKEIIQNADIAMYKAKEQGKNSYMVFTAGASKDLISRAETENRMRSAIENDFAGFQVYYQPVVNVSGAVKGAEALIRWVDKSGNLISPGLFIELAEYLGLIIPLGEFVLRTAALECKRANERLPDFTVNVNVSIRQFQQQDFVDRVQAVLAETGVNPANMILEVTEGLAIHDLQQMKRILDRLRGMGLKVALDDFGTGYSSLNNMREIPLDIIKIDRSFIIDITTDAYSKTFVRLISDLCHSMGRQVCVEGVETREQLRYCVLYGADLIQGYYFWKPLPAEKMRELLLEENAFPVEL